MCWSLGRLCLVSTISFFPEVAFLLNKSRNFRVIYGLNYAINCTAYLLGCSTGKQGQAHLYPPKEHEGMKFLDWVEYLVRITIKQTSTGVQFE